MTIFAKRHYEAVAETIKDRLNMAQHLQNQPSRFSHYLEIASSLADTASDNGSFKRDKFLKACGFTID